MTPVRSKYSAISFLPCFSAIISGVSPSLSLSDASAFPSSTRSLIISNLQWADWSFDIAVCSVLNQPTGNLRVVILHRPGEWGPSSIASIHIDFSFEDPRFHLVQIPFSGNAQEFRHRVGLGARCLPSVATTIAQVPVPRDAEWKRQMT